MATDVFYPEQPDYIERLNELNARAIGKAGVVDDGVHVTIDIGANPERFFAFVLTGNRQLVITGGTVDLDMKQVLIRVTQDAAGGHALTTGASSRFGTDVTSISISTVISKTSYIAGLYYYPANVLDIVSGGTKGY